MNILVLEQFANAKDVIRIAYRNATVKPIGVHDHCNSDGRLGGIAALRLGDDAALWNSMAHEVVFANAAFAEGGISCCAASCNYNRSYSAMKQVERMIEA